MIELNVLCYHGYLVVVALVADTLVLGERTLLGVPGGNPRPGGRNQVRRYCKGEVRQTYLFLGKANERKLIFDV